MSPQPVPLGVLDLVPISSGATPGEALSNTVDLAQRTEDFGYQRYWFAEHHLNPGVAGSSPAVLIALVAAATQRIRLGSGGVQSGHRTALSVVEEFGLIDALHPGRLDLGLGRSGGRNFLRDRESNGSNGNDPPRSAGESERRYTDNGLLIPERYSFGRMVKSSRLKLTSELLQQANAESTDYETLLREIVGLLHGTFRSAEGLDPHPVPGQGAKLEVWVLGSSAGQSAAAAGKLGLRFAANYHVSPATVLEAVDAYREAFVPSTDLERPYVAVSADAVVGQDDESARELAAGYGLWVRSIRRGEGPSPSRLPRRRPATSGAARTTPSSPTASTPSSSVHPRLWPPGSGGCRKRPEQTNWLLRRSPTTTPTGCDPTNYWRRSGWAELKCEYASAELQKVQPPMTLR
jgi:alkanesulfonate monooxygenase SsuD/methylene tetrahydromethanopterin reductase-like flavin-dependent oxidoreductase (luciferase family)